MKLDSIRTCALRTAIALLLLPLAAAAQTTFTVTVQPKTASNPTFGMGSSEAYYIDGEEARQLVLMRGTAYTFQMSNVPEMHPFYITTSDVGDANGIGRYDVGVTGNMATGSSTLMFTPQALAPDLLFYQCAAHPYMGWIIQIQGSVSGIRESLDRSGFAMVAAPNPFTDGTSIALRTAQTEPVRVTVHDALGRLVSVLHDGMLAAGDPHSLRFDGAGLPAGMYEIRVQGKNAMGRERVMLVR